MRKLQKVFAMLLAVCMVMSLLSVTAFAEEAGKSSDIQVVEDGGKMYYLASGEEAGPENFDVWTSKTIAGTDKEDEFEITLQVGTTKKAIPNDIAVVLVMDVSGSMMNDEDGNRWYENNMPEGKKRRIEYTREAAQAFAEAYVEHAGGAERMLSVVQFGNNAMTLLPWTNANAGGVLSETARDALEAVEVNFTVDPTRDNWDEEQALEDFGKVDYWDSSEASAVMVDHFVDYFQNAYQAAEMSDYFRSYLETTETTSCCTYADCERTDAHTHCAYENCALTEAHTHCAAEGCTLTQAHFHCSACDDTTEHSHCTYEGCTVAEAHTHCAYEGCTLTEDHSHCDRCGLTTSDHTHIVGCTLSGCLTPYEGPHTHCCVRGGDSIDRYYCRYNRSWGSYGYRCKDPNPDHTHEFLDSDTAYLTGSRYFGSVWAIGTNMEAGLLLARNLVSTGLAEGGAIEDIDNVYVILLSDGKPTWRTDETSTTEVTAVGQANNTGTWDALKDIVKDGGENDIAIAEDIKKQAELYAILYSNELEKTFDAGADHPLTGVSGADWITQSGDYYVGADAVFNSPAADGLDTAFLDINDRIDLLAKAWVVTDELGGIQLGDDVDFVEFTLNGQYAAATPATDSKNTTISWSLGAMEPESGTGSVADPYIYTLKYKVKLNSAKDNVKETSLAHDADSTLDAVWTNNGASLQYFMVDKEQLDAMTPEEIAASMRTAAFDKPSVKGIYGDYEFIKKNGETGEVMEGVGFKLYDTAGKACTAEVLSDSEGKVTFADIPRGEYYLVEISTPSGMETMDPLGMQVSWGVVTTPEGGALPEVIYNYSVKENQGGGGGSSYDYYKVTVNYYDKETGESIAKSYTQLIREGKDYDVTDKDAIEISGYTYDSTTGDPLTGTMDSNKVINVYYVKGTADIPEGEVPTTNIPEGDVPTTGAPEGSDGAPVEELPEEEVPLASVPKTGDMSALWLALTALSGAGLAFCKKRKEN